MGASTPSQGLLKIEKVSRKHTTNTRYTKYEKNIVKMLKTYKHLQKAPKPTKLDQGTCAKMLPERIGLSQFDEG